METIKVYPSTPNPVVPATPVEDYSNWPWQEDAPEEKFPKKDGLNPALPISNSIVTPYFTHFKNN